MPTEDRLNEPRTLVQLVLIDESGDSYYRMRWPGRDLSAAAPNWRVISLDANAEERYVWAEKADLLILLQSSDPDLLAIIERRRAAGKKTVVEYNDNYYDPPASSPVYDVWSSPHTWAIYEKMMKMADAVIVTGPGLKQLFSKKIKTPIFEIKNQLPEPELPSFETLWKNKIDTAEEIRIGWGGSLGHMPDLLAFLPIVRELIAEFPKLKFHVMGNESIPHYLDIPLDRFQFFPWGSMRQYFQFLEPLHLGFVPLLDTPYNECRSDIKAVEMSSRGVLPILPRHLPYEDFLIQSKSKPYSSVRDLTENLHALLRNPAEIPAAAERCHAYVKTSRLSCQHRERLDLCLQLMPAKSSDFDWNLPPGYHEISGTHAAQPRYRNTLLKAQSLFNNRQRTEGLHILTEAIHENPDHPEFALAHLKSLKSINLSESTEASKSYAKKFEDDLRFTLFQIESLQNLSERLHIWKKLILDLSKFPPFARMHFQPHVAQLAKNELKENAELSDLAKEVLDLFPDALSLRYELARSLEYQGRKHEAHHEFKIIFDAADSLNRNKDFLTNLNIAELRTWLTATTANEATRQRT